MDRTAGKLEMPLYRFIDFFSPGDTLVINQTKVIRRLFACKSTGARIEILLLNQQGEYGKPWSNRPGACPWAVGVLSGSFRGGNRSNRCTGKRRTIVAFSNCPDVMAFLDQREHAPAALHQSIGYRRRQNHLPDGICPAEGSAAAPTAGLHFTEELQATSGHGR
jgi:S-adenosylmethionine:tRNA ribosyltransferase-isomerase